jgi:hypothetical protein
LSGESGGRARVGVRPPSDGLAFRVRAQVLPLEIAQFVLRGEIRGGVPRAALETDDLHAGLAELGREYSAGPSDPDNDDIGFFNCHARISRHA